MPKIAPSLLADGPAPLPEDKLARLARLVARQRELTREVDDLLAKTKDKLKELDRVAGGNAGGVFQVGEIPELMLELGVPLLELPDGTRVTVKEELFVSTTGSYRDKINLWLKGTEGEDLIKDAVTVEFGKGKLREANEFVAGLEAEGYEVGRLRAVNAASFKAYVAALRATAKERGLPDGIPYEDLGVTIKRQSKLSTK